MDIKSILFPVDFSDRCAAVVPYVEAAAVRFGASVTLLYLVEPLVMPYGPREQPASLAATAEEMLRSFGSSAFAGVTVIRVVETADPASGIASLAREWGVGLIMMPTRGLGIFRAALLGSVTAKVLHDAACPVWTSAHVDEQSQGLGTQGQHRDWRNIVCAINLSSESTRLIRVARDLNRTIGATIRIAHAVPGEEALHQHLLDAEFENYLSQQATKTIESIQSDAGTDFEVCIETGDVSHAIASCARRHEADLVLAGSGRHTYAIIRDATCPSSAFEKHARHSLCPRQEFLEFRPVKAIFRID